MLCVTLGLLIPSDDSSAQMRSYFQKRHLLYGSVEFDYEQVWGEDVSEFREFSQNYSLGLRSYIIDPRLVNYNTSVSYTRQKDSEENASSLKGFDFNMNFLETPPRKWYGFRKYIPGPITLRYSDYANDYSYRNYGIGIIYSIPEEQIKRGPAKKDKKEAITIPLPTIFFDYDKSEYSSGNYINISDLYSLRAILSRNSYHYQFTYEDYTQSGTAESNRTTLTLRPDYSFYDKETQQKTDFNNFIKIEELDRSKQLFLSSSVSLHKPVNKDTLYFSGGAEYTSVEIAEESAEHYLTRASGAYTKVFSPKLNNTSSLTLTYGESKSATRHSERLSDSVFFDISKVFSSSGGVFIGENENGSEYGINTQLSTKTKIRASGGYSYSSLSYEDGDKSVHIFNVLASGPLKNNMNFNASTLYTMQDVTDVTGPYTEDIISSSANLFWRLQMTSLSLGSNYAQTRKDDGQTTTTEILSFNGNMSKVIRRNMLLNLYSTWTHESDDKTTIEVRPLLRWWLRRITADVEYKYLRTETPLATTTENRVFVKFIRRFNRFL